ncbi:MAG: alpha-2-macroglobulin family protein [Thermoguttaceae bacterium]
MKRALAWLGMCLLGAAAIGAMAGKSREDLWKKVDEAQKKGLPKTAIEALDPIIQGAIADKAYPEAIKAIGRKIALEGNIQGNKPEEKIHLLEAEIAKAPKEMLPVMEAILAEWYWHYFQHNRWRFVQRTQTAEAPGKDFTTWDLPRILAEIDRHFIQALTYGPLLRTIKVSQYDDLLEKGTLPDSYRPTMYDFIVHEALDFYSAGEQAGAKAEDNFELSAASPIFAPAEEFTAWTTKTTDELSPTLKAIRLYQHLLRFHEKDEDRTAWLDDDLLRLQFGHNKAFGEEKNARYKAALKHFVDKYGDHEVSARARFLWASVLQQENELVEAHKLAQQGWDAFKTTVGGRMCYNLMQQIEAKNYQVHVERVWNEPWPAIRVTYRNLAKMSFRLVRQDWAERMKQSRQQVEYLDDAQRQALLAAKPEREWAEKLPPTEDFRERTEELAAPKDLKPGFYFLLASPDPGFGAANNIVTCSNLWVSDLALVVRTVQGASAIEGFVLEAGSGEPVAGADVQLWWSTWNTNWTPDATAKTDKNGLFSVAAHNQCSHALLVTSNGRQLASGNNYWIWQGGPQQPRPSERTVFFTDRSLYRPGQTIQYKGICISVDQEADNYKAIAGRVVTVLFRDVSGKEIARQEHRTNDYGSFSGSFTAPRDRLMGRMSILVEGQPHGQAAVTVEEYKRPKFQVTLETPKTAAKLGDKVLISGKALAYTGAAVDGAKLRWRVVREVRFPDWWGWCFWWRPMPSTAAQEIAHGTAKTGADGTFTVEFTAHPDPSVSEKDEPIFHYTAYADVTDTAGETRSGQRTVNVGYTALAAKLSTAEWLTDAKPVEITVATTTLDGEGQKADVQVKVYRLKQPEKVHRASLDGHVFRPIPVRPPLRRGRLPAAGAKPEVQPDPSNPDSWELGEVAAEEGVTTDGAGKATVRVKLAAGPYRVKLATQDRFGKKVTAQLPLTVLRPEARQFPVRIPDFVGAPKWTIEPGEEFMALWGTGYERARAYVEIEHRHKTVQSFWTEPGASQQPVKQAVTEAMRGGFTLHVTMVRENRGYLTSRHVDVPWTNKKLTVAWEHFTSKLAPGQKETWTAVVSGPDAKRAVAEMVAALYDQSLDAYLAHAWPTGFQVFRQDSSNRSSAFENLLKALNHLQGQWPADQKDTQYSYRRFPAELVANLWGYGYFGGGKGMSRGAALGMPMNRMDMAAGMPPAAPMAATRRALQSDALGEQEQLRSMDGARKSEAAKQAGGQDKPGVGGGPAQPPPGPDLSQVSARKNLNETAFFFPQLVSDKDGVVRLEFTMPEALTQWKFLGFAHDSALRSGYLEDKVVTAKDLMVQPNPPRFLREGDEIEMTVKVTNQSAAAQKGSVRLTLADARTAKPVDAALGNAVTDQAFDIPSKESRSFAWKLSVPDGLGPLSYKAVGSTGRISDGEEGFLPVLTRRVLVTESLPLPIRGPATKQFDFERLRKSGQSKTIQSQALTVQMVSNPAWYGVMALPYLMEFPYECSEQVFNRFYANSLARHIATSDPKIRRVFDQWKYPQAGAQPALDSPLEKNQDLKMVVLEETPWVRQAQAESQARKNVGVLFDDNRLNDETARNFQKLAQMQLGDGAWPWFPGGPPNDYITLYITTGFGRLRHLGVKCDVAPALKSLGRLDGWIDQIYREILKHEHKDDNHLSPTIALYLYGRSFFLTERPVAPQQKEAVEYFLAQAKKHWLGLADRQSQGHLAVALKRFGDKAAATDIMRSIKERSVSNEEMGMFWRETELSWWWYRAPIETQALMIEAFDEVMNDAKAVEDCKVWLLKQKQTQDWKTTKATADAVYALLLRGEDLLASDALVEVTLGDQTVRPEKVEAGTGFYEQRFVDGQIKPDFGRITLKKIDPGVAWGSLHWQYLEDMSKVTAYEGTPLVVQKALYTRQNSVRGPVLERVKGPVQVGDELVTRIVLRVDRDMEYVHLRDHRGSGTEPTNVLSRYKFQDGLYYYESTRDTATHFFIDYLPKGTYVFEYAVRVQLAGTYQTGFAAIQCMYAPEFNSHSESLVLEVK